MVGLPPFGKESPGAPVFKILVRTLDDDLTLQHAELSKPLVVTCSFGHLACNRVNTVNFNENLQLSSTFLNFIPFLKKLNNT